MTIDERVEKLIEERGSLPLQELINSDRLANCLSKSIAEWVVKQDYEAFYYTLALAWKLGYDQAKTEQMEKEFTQQ